MEYPIRILQFKQNNGFKKVANEINCKQKSFSSKQSSGVRVFHLGPWLEGLGTASCGSRRAILKRRQKATRVAAAIEARSLGLFLIAALVAARKVWRRSFLVLGRAANGAIASWRRSIRRRGAMSGMGGACVGFGARMFSRDRGARVRSKSNRQASNAGGLGAAATPQRRVLTPAALAPHRGVTSEGAPVAVFVLGSSAAQFGGSPARSRESRSGF